MLQKREKQPKQIPVVNRRIVESRSNSMCEICGLVQAVQIHHRQYRSRGGGHEVSNLLAVCGLGNTGGCHKRAHSVEGKEFGWAVSSWETPNEVPVRHAVHGWVTLNDDGSITYV